MSSASEQNNCDVHLHAAATEIEALKLALIEKQNQLVAMETACIRESDRQVELEDSVIAWQDKYDRLYESHKRVQKVNQSLEDKLLKLVDRNSGERAQLTSDVATLSVRLAQANYNIAKLQRETERYKADINLAIQLLQCKPDSFLPQKVSSLPIDIQSKVSSYMRLETNSHSDSEGSTSGVGVATSGSYKVLPASDSPPPPCPFPPTAMVYSMRGLDASLNNNNATINLNNNNSNRNNEANNNKNSTNTLNTSSSTLAGTIQLPNGNDREVISPSIMAKFLEDELKACEVKHCDTCQCSSKDMTVLADVSRSYSVATQTPFHQTTGNNGGGTEPPIASLCLRCNSNLNSPSRTNSPYLLKLVKSSDSVISETKSSVSDLNDVDKLFTPAKRDDLMVNPILGHHRLCDRTNNNSNTGGGGGTKFSSMMYPTTHLHHHHHQSYISDTATKYILESSSCSSRKFLDGGGTALELIDLRKYDETVNKSPIKKPDDGSEANANDDAEDEAKPLLGSTANDTSWTELGHNNEAAAEREKSKKTAHSSELTKTAGNLLQSAISGSVNSLWSKTSSCEGAKMFENFNRNLIRTIKAENPKYRGPRLCAMRIQQNGQSNILLDNVESMERSPIIYTRRERFLDEELSDTKDIITSDISTIMTNQPPPQVTLNGVPGILDKEETEEAKKMERKTTTSCEISSPKCSDDEGVAADQGEKCTGSDLNTKITVHPPNSSTQATSISPGPAATAVATCDIASDRQLTNSYLGQQFKNLLTGEQQQQLLKASFNYDMLHLNDSSCKNSQNSKSCTQSSSVSEAIDFQESVLLRRQQLSRVAEWVQKNSQLEHQQQQQQPAANSSTLTNEQHHQASFNPLDHFDSVSMEKLSMDSGYKTTPQQPVTNGFNRPSSASIAAAAATAAAVIATSATDRESFNEDRSKNYKCNNNSHNQSITYFHRTGRSGIITQATVMPASLNGNITPLDNFSHTPTCDILNYKYYPTDSDQSQPVKAELHTSRQSVDIAQMEYNVKQFLLKQNEWSMRSSRGVNTTATTTTTTKTTTTATSSNVSSSNTPPQSTNLQTTPRNTLRHSKLFNGTGIGPGVGERVCTGLRKAPHRTETNL